MNGAENMLALAAARKLRQVRRAHEICQEAAADKAGVSRVQYNRIERLHHVPNLETFLKIARALVELTGDAELKRVIEFFTIKPDDDMTTPAAGEAA
jgi:DNA-binding XRE family transcriptional regulator